MSRKEASRKPTLRDFEIFKKEFLRCIALLELGEWHIFFEFRPVEGCYAELTWEADAYTATVTLNNVAQTGINARDFDPKRHARHEAAHLFIARLQSIGKWRFVIPDMFTAESERIARTLEKIL